MGAVPPDGYLPGDREIGKVLIRQVGGHVDQLGDYVIIAQVSLPDPAWDVIISPNAPVEHVPCLLRRVADQLDDRTQAMLS